MQTLDSIIASLAPVLGPVSTAGLVLLVLAAWWTFWGAPRIKIRHNPGSEEELEDMRLVLVSMDEKLGRIIELQKDLITKIDTNNAISAHRLGDIWAKVNNYKGE